MSANDRDNDISTFFRRFDSGSVSSSNAHANTGLVIFFLRKDVGSIIFIFISCEDDLFNHEHTEIYRNRRTNSSEIRPENEI